MVSIIETRSLRHLLVFEFFIGRADRHVCNSGNRWFLKKTATSFFADEVGSDRVEVGRKSYENHYCEPAYKFNLVM